MSSRYDNDSEDVVQENKKQTEAINKYIIGTLKMYIDPEIFVKNPSGNTKKRKMPSVYYTRRYTETPSEVQKTQKAITNEQAANKLPSGSGASGASGTSGITTGTGTGMGQQPPFQQQMQQQMQQQQPMQQQQQQQQPMQLQQQQMQQQQMQRPQQQPQQQQLVRRPTEVMGGGAESMYGMGSMGMGGVSGLNVQATSISSRIDPNAEPYIASLIKFSNAGFPPYSTIKSQVDTFFNLRAFRGFLKRLGNPVTIRDPSNQPIDVENALSPPKKNVDGEEKVVPPTPREIEFRKIFGNTSRDNTSSSSSTKEYTKDGISGSINFWSTNAVPQKIGKAFIFLYTIPSPQESRQQAQLSGQGRNLNANKPMMLMVKDGNEYSLIGGYVDNTIKQLLANNTQVSSENETEVTKPDVISNTIKKEFSSKTGTSFPQSIASKYLLYKIGNYDKKLTEFKEQLTIEQNKFAEVKKRISIITNEVGSLEKQKSDKEIRIRLSRLDRNDDSYQDDIEEEIEEILQKIIKKNKELNNEKIYEEECDMKVSVLMGKINGINKNKEILPVIIYAVQVNQNTMQSIIQSSKSRTTLASGELVMVPIITIYNVLSNKQVSDNIAISKLQNQLLQLTIGILQQEKIISQIADASQIGTDYYNDKKDERKFALEKILSPDSISEIDDIIKHNIKFMLGIFFSYKNSFSYSGNQYIINSVDWNDTFQQVRDLNKLLKRMNASYYITLKLFLEKLEPGKLPSDRKGTFLESCGVKGAIIRNEWKNNFESRTLKEWKALLPIPIFGKGKGKGKDKGKGEGEGIFNKLVPSFIKNAIKSIQNPLMSPLDPGVLQVSLIQYSLLGETELQEYYSKIENSFAGVAWKNDNTWEKRKQRLFSAMDECQADIYCFQNVQCSIAVYNQCIKDGNLSDDQIQTLRDINKLLTYRERLNLYFDKIHDRLISTHDSDGTNCVSDICEKYKDSYDFVYFFEQVFYTSENFNKNYKLSSMGDPNRLYPEYDKQVALGNLTMVKKSKFEIEKKLRYDVRIGAAFCLDKVKKDFSREFSTLFDSGSSVNPLPGVMSNSSRPNQSSTPSSPNVSFAPQYNSICMNKSFASMVYIKFRTSDPSVAEAVAEEIPPQQNKTEQVINDELVSDETKLIDEHHDIIKENTEEGEGEGEEEGEVVKKYTNVQGRNQGRNQGGGAPTWYDKDTTEVEGYDRKLKEDIDASSKKKDKTDTPPEPQICFDTKDVKFIPTTEHLFGICNIKFDTKDIIIPDKLGLDTGLPLDDIQVVLMAIFIYKLRFNMQSSGLRLTNLIDTPFIVSGVFRDMVSGTSYKPILNYALKLLTTTQLTPWKNHGSFFKDNIDKFVKSMPSILTYLRVGTFRLAGFIFKQHNSKLLGDVYPLEQRSGTGSSISELIVCPRNFKICDDSKIMHKMIPIRNTDASFPIFPNKVNPSNSVAIGGVFDITTPAIKSHVEQVKANIEEKKLADDAAVKKAQLEAVQYEDKGTIKYLQKFISQPKPSAPVSAPSDADAPSAPSGASVPASAAVVAPVVETGVAGDDSHSDSNVSALAHVVDAADAPVPAADAPVPVADAPVPVADANAKAEEEARIKAAAQKVIDDAAKAKAAAAAQKVIDDAAKAKAAAAQKVIDDAKALAAASLATKYIFAFDIDNTLVKQYTIDNLSTALADVQFRQETIANMKKVIDSRNYVWIVTANTEYSKDKFTENYFGPVDKDFFGKSHYFLFMNPHNMARIYTKAKSDDSLPADDKAKLGNITEFKSQDIHTKGLKPYAMYAQSLLYINGDFFKKNHFSIVKMYLFDDMSGSIQTNSKNLGITFTLVTDFATSRVPNLLTEFKRVLDDGTSKIGSAKAPFIPDEYKMKDANTNNDVVIKKLMASNAELPKCEPEEYANKNPYLDDAGLIGDAPYTIINVSQREYGPYNGNIFNNLQVCTNGVANYNFLTDSDIISWNDTDDICSDHAPIIYIYQINSKSNIECFYLTQASSSYIPKGLSNISFITWNIAYQMELTSSGYYTSKFYCSTIETNPTECVEDEKIYKKRLTNILTQVDNIMNYVVMKYMNYVFLQECTQTLLDVVANVPGFNDNYKILHKSKNKGISEFCLVVRKSALPRDDDIIFFDFDENMGDTPMSKYISSQFYSYDIEVNTDVKTDDLKRVMCYIVKSRTTIFFNVHFVFGKTLIFHRQIQLYNFMNAIVYTIRSIPSSNKELYEYQNYDIVFTGDFNLNMLQRFPRDIKRFGYPNENMIPIFFTCNYIPGQKTIISTTELNKPSARATNELDNNYNLTNIDFSILYPRIGDAGPIPTPVTIVNKMPIKLKLPVAPVGSVGSSTSGSSGKSASKPPVSASASTSANTLRVMSFNTWYKPFNALKNNEDGSPQEKDMQYCNVKNADGTSINACQENIMKEIMTQIKEGFEVIFLQEFTSRIQEVFDKCEFSDKKVPTTEIPFTMAYTPPEGKDSPLEYYVYSVTAQGETITTLCSKKFFPKPATNYYMGNLTGYPNNPSYTNDGGVTTQFWEISGGGRPYIVLVFDDIEMILINIHGPHRGTFNPYLQKVSVISDGKPKFIPIGVKDIKGKYNYNPELGSSIPPVVQIEIDKKIAAVTKLNKEYPDPTLQDYSFRQLGDMLRKRIPQKLKDYRIIFAGDFNMPPDEAKTHLVKLSERQSNETYKEGPFSNSLGKFDKQAQNSVTLTIGDTGKPPTGTCCVEHKGGSYGSVYDHIYSNKLNITKYWTYNGTIEYDKSKKGGILFSDHLPVYAEIAIPASGTPESYSGGSKRFTLRNNSNNNSKPTSRKIRKSASTSMPTTKFSKKKRHSMHKHKTRRHKH